MGFTETAVWAAEAKVAPYFTVALFEREGDEENGREGAKGVPGWPFIGERVMEGWWQRWTDGMAWRRGDMGTVARRDRGKR